MRLTRRDSLAMGGAALAGATATPLAAAGDAIAADLSRYIGFGPKPAGGKGDEAAAHWIAEALARAGFAVERRQIDIPWFESTAATLTSGAARSPVLPLPIVVPTAAGGVSGPLVAVRAGLPPLAGLSGAIALLELPFGRWSSALAKAVREPLDLVMAQGAAAAVIVTTGPTGEAIALNVDGNRPMASRPVAVIGPAAAQPFLAAAANGERANLRIVGAGGRRPAANLVARLDRGRDRWLVISTPRSGWTTCAGERGPGIAAFLALARMAPSRWPECNLMFLCNGGHEYENLGAAHAIARSAPPPAATALWLHLGANVAARDWHEAGAAGLLPLPSADPQRFLVTAADLVETARSCFAGHPGLEMAYPASAGAAGELGTVLAAGYSRAAGIFGAHRHHHVATDDARCVEPGLVARVMPAIGDFIDRALR